MLPVPGGDKEWYLYAARAGLSIGVASHRRGFSLNTIDRGELRTNRPAPPPFSPIMARQRRWLAVFCKIERRCPVHAGELPRYGRPYACVEMKVSLSASSVDASSSWVPDGLPIPGKLDPENVG